MAEGKILGKDVKAFVKDSFTLYASTGGKRFFVCLHAGPGVKRYVVAIDGERKGFTNVGEAVRYFNAS